MGRLDEKKTKLTRQIDTGEAANAVLTELEQAFEALEQDCFETFKNAAVHDDDGRRACSLYLRVMEDVKQRFVHKVRTGSAARKELIQLNEPKVSKING